MQPQQGRSLNPPPGLSPLGFPVTPRAAVRFSRPVMVTDGSGTESGESSPRDMDYNQLYTNVLESFVGMKQKSTANETISPGMGNVISSVPPVYTLPSTSTALPPPYTSSGAPNLLASSTTPVVPAPPYYVMSAANNPVSSSGIAGTQDLLSRTNPPVTSNFYRAPGTQATVKTMVPRFPNSAGYRAAHTPGYVGYPKWPATYGGIGVTPRLSIYSTIQPSISFATRQQLVVNPFEHDSETVGGNERMEYASASGV